MFLFVPSESDEFRMTPLIAGKCSEHAGAERSDFNLPSLYSVCFYFILTWPPDDHKLLDLLRE